ncbi:uncharacterized protein LOC115363792 [Myripristis murdjan]|uniref:uncharacterized protein LOC115363792 n=1 Tax=Myripristis murdjan TaxID=586833 RepID=UPI001175E5C0|nr:uncharacterized protein LOC115363792 [Myripristis murdjan]
MPSPRLPPRPPSLRRPRPPSPVSLGDPADEEVYHITSSARHWWRDYEEGRQGGRGAVGRSHSLSPYATPHSLDSASTSCAPPPPPPPPPLPASSTRSSLCLLGVGLKDRDFRKGFSVDNQGFLNKPSHGYPDDQRRHSIEICLPQAAANRDDQAYKEGDHWLEKGGRPFPMRVQSVGGGHRKKKMSPPCISIHPPSEREHPQTALPPELVDCSMMLRRRTPSYDLTPHTHSNMHMPDIMADTYALTPTHSLTQTAALTPIHLPVRTRSSTGALTPTQALTPTHTQAYTPPRAPTPTQAHTPVHPHIPISPNIFIQPHAPVHSNPMPFPQAHTLSPTARLSPLTSDYRPLPRFTFDQPESRYMSGLSAGLSDADPAACPAPFDNRLESGAGFSAKNRRTAQ